MVTKIQKWGNSQGLRIGKELLADAGIGVGEAVDVVLQDGVITITPLHRVRGGCDLLQLINRIPADYETQELPWGTPSGREDW